MKDTGILGVLLMLSIALRQRLSLNQKLVFLDRLTGQQAPEIYLSPPYNNGVKDICKKSGLLHGCRRLELRSSCSHCKHSQPLSQRPQPQPFCIFVRPWFPAYLSESLIPRVISAGCSSPLNSQLLIQWPTLISTWAYNGQLQLSMNKSELFFDPLPFSSILSGIQVTSMGDSPACPYLAVDTVLGRAGIPG